jgi:hypothetical protein
MTLSSQCSTFRIWPPTCFKTPLMIARADDVIE